MSSEKTHSPLQSMVTSFRTGLSFELIWYVWSSGKMTLPPFPHCSNALTMVGVSSVELSGPAWTVHVGLPSTVVWSMLWPCVLTSRAVLRANAFRKACRAIAKACERHCFGCLCVPACELWIATSWSSCTGAKPSNWPSSTKTGLLYDFLPQFYILFNNVIIEPVSYPEFCLTTIVNAFKLLLVFIGNCIEIIIEVIESIFF